MAVCISKSPSCLDAPRNTSHAREPTLGVSHLTSVTAAFILKKTLDKQEKKYKKFDTLNDMVVGTVFFLATVLLLVPTEVCPQT